MAEDSDDSEDEFEEFLVTNFLDDTEEVGFMYDMF